jgi:hypothetical protein
LPELRKQVLELFADGAYYVMTDISAFGFKDDIEFTRHLIREVGVACVLVPVSTAIPPSAPSKCASVSARRMKRCCWPLTD